MSNINQVYFIFKMFRIISTPRMIVVTQLSKAFIKFTTMLSSPSLVERSFLVILNLTNTFSYN